MLTDVKTSMDRFEDIEAGEVFLFCEDLYLKTTMEDDLGEDAIVCINLDNGEPRLFKDQDLVISIPGSFVEINLYGED